MEYKTAKTYTNWTRVGEPFEKNKKMYQKVKTKCDRCGGLGLIASRVENGQIIPIPVANGICFKCSGSKYIYKEVRLYTEEEYNKMELANEKVRQKKAEELENKMKAEFQNNKKKWLFENGFNENGSTWIVTGDSFNIKEELKENNFIFNYVLKWHKAEPDPNYNTIEIKMDDIIDFSAWGEGHYKNGAADYIEKILVENSEDASSAWIGTKGDKIDVDVTFVSKRGYQGRYGYSNVYTFKTAEGNLLTWFSTVEVKKEIGEKFELIATVKDHNEYKGIKSTIITRGKVK